MFPKLQGSKVSTSPPSSMNILAWNCRGLARGPTIRALRALIRNYHPDLLFLSETKVSSSRFQPSLFGLGFSAWLEVPPSGLQGGLYLAWKNGVDVEPVRLDRNCIACLVYSDPTHCPWLFSGIYAPPNSQSRDIFWFELSAMGNSFGGAWLLLGDFNSILSAAEKSGGREFGTSSHGNFVDFVNYNVVMWGINSLGAIVELVGITLGKGWIGGWQTKIGFIFFPMFW
jgi:hypothetical protein